MTRLNIPPSTTSLINSAEAEMRSIASVLGRPWAMSEMLPRTEEAEDRLIGLIKELRLQTRQLKANAEREARASNIERKSA